MPVAIVTSTPITPDRGTGISLPRLDTQTNIPLPKFTLSSNFSFPKQQRRQDVVDTVRIA
jgi:hypothetical protein